MVPEKKLRVLKLSPNWIPAITTNPYGWNIVYLLALKQNNNLKKKSASMRRIHFTTKSKKG
jgi:hypothetical protein